MRSPPKFTPLNVQTGHLQRILKIYCCCQIRNSRLNLVSKWAGLHKPEVRKYYESPKFLTSLLHLSVHFCLVCFRGNFPQATKMTIILKNIVSVLLLSSCIIAIPSPDTDSPNCPQYLWLHSRRSWSRWLPSCLKPRTHDDLNNDDADRDQQTGMFGFPNHKDLEGRSVFPRTPGASPVIPMFMVCEKASEVVLRDEEYTI